MNTSYQPGKFDNLKKEAERMMLDVVGVSEVRWAGSGLVKSNGCTFYYLGGDRLEAGFGVLLKGELTGE